MTLYTIESILIYLFNHLGKHVMNSFFFKDAHMAIDQEKHAFSVTLNLHLCCCVCVAAMGDFHNRKSGQFKVQAPSNLRTTSFMQ